MITTDSACLLGEISDGTKRLLGQACPNQEQKSELNKSHKVLSFCTGQSVQVSKTCSDWSQWKNIVPLGVGIVIAHYGNPYLPVTIVKWHTVSFFVAQVLLHKTRKNGRTLRAG